MKTLLILSDTHGNIKEMENLTGIMKDSDYIFHLGDYQKDIKLFKEFDNKIYSVKGNCDLGNDEIIVEIENLKILLTHGHKYKVKSDLTDIYLRAKELNVNVVCFGHTHRPIIEEHDNITLINPGTLGGYGYMSYCYAVINKDKIVAKTVYLNN